MKDHNIKFLNFIEKNGLFCNYDDEYDIIFIEDAFTFLKVKDFSHDKYTLLYSDSIEENEFEGKLEKCKDWILQKLNLDIYY